MIFSENQEKLIPGSRKSVSIVQNGNKRLFVFSTDKEMSETEISRCYGMLVGQLRQVFGDDFGVILTHGGVSMISHPDCPYCVNVTESLDGFSKKVEIYCQTKSELDDLIEALGVDGEQENKVQG